MFGLINKIKARVHDKKEAIKRQQFLEKRKAKYPNSSLADTCEVSDSDLGSSVVLYGNVRIRNCSLKNHIYICKNSSLNYVDIGNYCSIARNVRIGLPRHPTSEYFSTYPAFFSTTGSGCPETFIEKDLFTEVWKKTVVGHDVWIGQDVTIPGGVTLGTGCVVAAGSVVVKNVKPYAIVGGNPAKLIHYRFSESEIDVLLASKWWELPDSDLRNIVFESGDVDKFYSEICEVRLNKRST